MMWYIVSGTKIKQNAGVCTEPGIDTIMVFMRHSVYVLSFRTNE